MDFAKIKRNIQRMIDQNAPEADIDAYVASEGATPEMLRGDQSVQVATSGKVDLPEPELSLGEQALDVAQSAGAGLRRGVEAVAGLPGDVNSLIGTGARFVAQSLPGAPELTPEREAQLAQVGPLANAPTTESIGQFTDSVVGESHTPQTTAGEFAKTIGEFAPAVAAPGGAIRKAAQVVVPAVASEAAGQLTEDTAAEPFARMGAALIGGIASAGKVGKASNGLIKGAPTAEELTNQKRALYDQLKNSGVTYDTPALKTAIVGLKNDLVTDGLLQPLAPKTYAIIDGIESSANQGQIAGFSNIEAMRKVAGRLVRSSDSEERAAAAVLRDALDDFTATAPLTNPGNMSRSDFVRTQKRARELARREIQGRAIDYIIEGAEDTAAGAEAGIRNGVRNLLKSARGRKLFRTPEERKALRQVANGRKTLQQLSRFGFDVTGGSGNAALIPGATALTGAVTGNPFAIAATVGGTIAKPLSPALTKRALTKAQAIVRAGPQAQKQALKAEEVEALEIFIRKALNTNNALSAGGE